MGNSKELVSNNMFWVRFTNFLKCFYKFEIFLISYKSEHYKYMNQHLHIRVSKSISFTCVQTWEKIAYALAKLYH